MLIAKINFLIGLPDAFQCYPELRSCAPDRPTYSRRAQRNRLGISYCNRPGLDFACTFVIHENDTSRPDNAFRHLERRWDRALGKQTFALAKGDRIDHQPEIINQVMLHQRLEQIKTN